MIIFYRNFGELFINFIQLESKIKSSSLFGNISRFNVFIAPMLEG